MPSIDFSFVFSYFFLVPEIGFTTGHILVPRPRLWRRRRRRRPFYPRAQPTDLALRTRTHAHTHTRTHTRTHTHTQPCVCTFVYVHALIHTYVCMHDPLADIHTRRPTAPGPAHADKAKYSYHCCPYCSKRTKPHADAKHSRARALAVFTCTRARTHTHTHTNTHTHTHI